MDTHLVQYNGIYFGRLKLSIDNNEQVNSRYLNTFVIDAGCIPKHGLAKNTVLHRSKMRRL